MSRRWLYAVFGVVAVIVGLHNFLTGGGSLIFGTHATAVHGLPKIHYTGLAAYIEGAIFIAAGFYCLYVAWRAKPDGDE